MAASRKPNEPGLSRREALLIALGRTDQVSLERERQSAIDAARGYEPGAEPPAEPEFDSRPLWIVITLLVLAGVALVAFLARRSGI
jgi:hypothetical protein